MLHLLPSNKQPLKYISCGNLRCEDGFVHPQRNLDTFVLLNGMKGEMHIAQGNSHLVLSPHTCIVLFPGIDHYGIRPTEGELSYFWCHFQLTNQRGSYLQTDEVIRLINNATNEKHENLLLDAFIISEHVNLDENGRTELLFHQLLDIAREMNYSHFMADYALSLLMLEISNQYFQLIVGKSVGRTKAMMRVFEIAEWLRTHYDENCSLQELATKFCYHPAYLSTFFKNGIGMTLTCYLTKLRIASVKNLLLNTDMTIVQIAQESGFSDDKHLMRVFKAQEYITPSQYRYSFFRKKINKK